MEQSGAFTSKMCINQITAVRCVLSLNCVVFFQAVNCKGQHSISYTLSRHQTVVVEYSHDKDTDMFQVNACLITRLDVKEAASKFPMYTAADHLVLIRS